MTRKRKKLLSFLKPKKENNNHDEKETTRKTGRKKRKVKKLVNLVALVFLIGCVSILLLSSAFIGYIIVSAPKFDPQNLYRKEASVIYDSKGEIIAKIGREMREKITYDEIPQIFLDAVIATEDSRFFQHNGFDLPRFAKASLGQLMGNSGAGGGSTITMQVVKNNFTSTKQTITRKFTDIYLALFKLEKQYTKEEILEFYVNAPYLGNNSYGIAEAARNYFGKEIQDINLSEAALLAGLFQAPGAYDPILYPDRAKNRRATVLYLMKRHGYISAEEEKLANAIPVQDLLVNAGTKGTPYQGYIDVVVAEATKKTGNNPYNVPMKIYTNLVPEKQQYVDRVLSGELFKFQNDVVQVGLAVLDIDTGGIVAIGNGRNRTGERLYNFATMLKRQIGSTAKPLFDYGPGIEFNNWSTYTPFIDDEYAYTNGPTISNWDSRYKGLMTSRDALVQSRNIPALKAFQQISNKSIVNFVTSLGITPEIENGRLHEAHAIGAFNGASPIQMAAAYAAFGNGGYYIEPYAINKVEYIDTNEIETYTSSKTRVMSEATAFMITDMLKYGVNTGAIGGGRVSGIEVAAKSGTTNFDEKTKAHYKLPDNVLNDLWYVGFSPDYSIGMWYGYEKIDGVHFSNSSTWSIRDRLFSTFARGIFDRNGKKFEAPKSVVKVSIEKGTIPAMLASKYTPSSLITSEYFKKGTEPTEVSPRFNTLDNPTGVDINTVDSKIELTWESTQVPNLITEEYIKTLGSKKDKYLAIRQKEDQTLLGTLGYNVYLKQSNGDLALLGWTADTSYTYSPTGPGNLTFVVKTAYSVFKDSASTGYEITISDNPYYPVVDVSLAGTSTITLKVGDSYSEQGVIVLANLVNVTDEASITTTITKNSDSQTVSSISTASPETYTVHYQVNYYNELYNLTRTVTVNP